MDFSNQTTRRSSSTEPHRDSVVLTARDIRDKLRYKPSRDTDIDLNVHSVYYNSNTNLTRNSSRSHYRPEDEMDNDVERTNTDPFDYQSRHRNLEFSDSSEDVGRDVEKARNPVEQKAEQPPKDPNVIEWDGPDDPENPMNFPTRRKWAITVSMSGLVCSWPPSKLG